MKTNWSVQDLPRAQLEEFAIRAAMEARALRASERPNRFFHVLMTGFIIGAALAGAGFLTGAAIR
ncbi:hypothetical protein [Aestuariivirga sp.]|uniref:hypothetical protein n=1 Tax=Aestuariivirga sp. TaxID=2650926 RepID=UPI0039E2891B